MIYHEKHLLRSRIYEIDEKGVSVKDNGYFKSTIRYFKFDSIGDEINYTQDEILTRILIVLALVSSSIYVVINYEIWGFILAFGFGCISVSVFINVLKKTSFVGTISFRNSNEVSDSELYLKSNIPFSEETQAFLDNLRLAKIKFYFKNILSNHHHYQLNQQHFITQLNGLKGKFTLSQIEYDDLYAELVNYFELNNIKEFDNEENERDLNNII